MNREDLKRYIGMTGHTLGHVEKDYFQHIILSAFSRDLAGHLIFKGGTALQKQGIVSRFSEDLDFTLSEKIDLERLCNVASLVIKRYNYQNEIDNKSDSDISMSFRIKIQGPLYRNRQGSCTVRVEVSKREKAVLPRKKLTFDPLYPNIIPYVLEIMDEREMLSEKIRAIYARNKARDLYDLYRLLSRSIDIDMDLVNYKLKVYNVDFVVEDFYEKCTLLKSNWERELGSLMEIVPPFDTVFENITSEIKQ